MHVLVDGDLIMIHLMHRPQRMEIVLADSLFPGSLSVEDRTRHWVFMFSLFTPCHLKALNAILSQKLRYFGEIWISLTSKLCFASFA